MASRLEVSYDTTEAAEAIASVMGISDPKMIREGWTLEQGTGIPTTMTIKLSKTLTSDEVRRVLSALYA